jgi:hypothetical protein
MELFSVTSGLTALHSTYTHPHLALSFYCCIYARVQILKKVKGEVQQLRVVLDGARKRGHERVWLNNQVSS